jgi:hypothetical protein
MKTETTDRVYDSIEEALKAAAAGPTRLESLVAEVGWGVVEVLRVLELRRSSPGPWLDALVDDCLVRLRDQVGDARGEYRDARGSERMVGVKMPLWEAESATIVETIDVDVDFDLWRSAIDTMVECSLGDKVTRELPAVTEAA